MQYIPGVLTGKAYVATGSGEHAPGQPTLSTVVSSAYIYIYIDTTGCAIMWTYMDNVLGFGKSSCTKPFSSWHKSIHVCFVCMHLSCIAFQKSTVTHDHTWNDFSNPCMMVEKMEKTCTVLPGWGHDMKSGACIILTHSCMHMQFWWGPTDVMFSQYFFTPWHACALHGLQLSWMIS